MTAPTKQVVTFTISIPAALHLGIGIVLAAATAAAFLTHTGLSASSPYAGDALAAGVVLSGITLTYWLWCSIERSRADNRATTNALKEAETAAAERDKSANEHRRQVLAALDSAVSTLTVIAEEVAQNGGKIKELSESVDNAAACVKVLSDCYLKEGRLLLLPDPEEVHRDVLLGRSDGPDRIRSGPSRCLRRALLPEAFKVTPLAAQPNASVHHGVVRLGSLDGDH